MNVIVYNGPNFCDHKKVYAGYMLREHPDSNEIYDPVTVEMKFDLTQSSKMCIPLIFDLETEEVIYTDLAVNTFSFSNIESKFGNIQKTLMSVVDMRNKVSLYKLFSLHAFARGNIVYYNCNKGNVQTVFSLDREDGAISPFDINKINSGFI
jgi:hypothetical protein